MPKDAFLHVSARDRTKIHTFFEADWSRSEIAARLGLAYSTVCRVLRGPETPPRHRLHPNRLVLGTPIRLRLREAALANRFTPFSVLADEMGLDASEHVLRASLEREGLGRFRTRIKPKTNPAIRAKRLEFARAHADWSAEDWKRVVWSDESAFRHDYGKIWVTRPFGEPCDADAVTNKDRGVKATLVWGQIHASGKRSLLIWDKELLGNVTAANYTQYMVPLLTQFRLELERDGYGPITIMEDNAPPHRARLTRDAHASAGNTLLDWPPHSPDLNPIENLWGLLKSKLSETRPDTARGIQDETTRLFHEIDASYFESLCNSMPNRMQLVLTGEGYPIDY